MSKEIYKLTIKTKYNTIHLETQDMESEEIKEILSQPYIVDIKVEKTKVLERVRYHKGEKE